MTVKLPIFPLNTVLFPGAPIQLHIFEDRYRLMIGRCIEQRSPFGVVLIRAGSEVNPGDPWLERQITAAGGGAAELSALRQQMGGDVVPYSIGTAAQIDIGESTRMADGRYFLSAVGQRRFRIQYMVQRQPYYIASVAYLPEESSAGGGEAAQQLRALYARICAAISMVTGANLAGDGLPDGVVDLTYWMAHRLQVDTTRKQRWLEADVATRLREMITALRAELALLPDINPGERERGWSGPGPWN